MTLRLKLMLWAALGCHMAYSHSITLHVYINTNQCANCNIALSALHKLPGEVIKTIHFPESNRAASGEMMEPYAGVKNFRLSYFETGNSPFKNPLTKSFCLLYRGGERLDSFELNGLFANISRIQSLLDPGMGGMILKKKIRLPDSIKLSDRLTFFYCNNRLSICDYLLNKNVTLSIKKDQSGFDKAIQVKGSAFKPQPFLRSGIIDTVVYRLRYADMKYVGKTKPEVNAAYLTDSALYLVITFPCGIVRPVEKDTGIGGALFLYKKDLITNISALFAIPESQLPTFLKEEYYIANLGAFFVKGKSVFFTLYQENIRSQNHLLAQYTIAGAKVIFKALDHNTVSDSVYLNTNFGNTQVFLSVNNARFYFANYQPYIIDTKSGTAVNLEKAVGKRARHELLMLDVAEAGSGILKILANVSGKEKILTCDASKNRIISESALNLPADINPESLKFVSPDTILALDKANRNLLIFGLN